MFKVICFDLDDTLYKEIDYLKSAYREIAFFAARGDEDKREKAYKVMMEAYYAGGNAFETLNAFLGLDTPVTHYLDIYRSHLPLICLSTETIKTLDTLKAEGYIIGLITDGRSAQQRSKIHMLRLNRWIDKEDIVISEEFGSEKPSLANFEYFMQRYPDCNDFTYVGDNPKKDFVAPNALGWKTICLKNDGRNIHQQSFEELAKEYLPDTIIESLAEIPKLDKCVSH